MIKKKVLHIFDGKNVHLNPNIIKGIFENKNSKHEHVFLIARLSDKSKKTDIDKYMSLKDAGYNLRFINSWFDFYKELASDRLLTILHGNVSPVKMQLLLLFSLSIFKKNALSKKVLIAWGGADFFNDKWWFFILKRILNQFKCIVTLSKVDFDRCSIVYPDRAVRIDYIVTQAYSNLFKSNDEKLSNGLKVFVSHSGWQQNKHYKSFGLIEKFKDEDIEVVCPLAYGDNDYINEVVDFGTRVFGSKFKFFTDLKEIDDYYQILSTADIFITSADIQTGLFAITTCLGGGAKVFCGDNLYFSLVNEGYTVYHVDDLKFIKYSDFCAKEYKAVMQNKNKYLNSFGNPKALNEKWTDLYDC